MNPTLPTRRRFFRSALATVTALAAALPPALAAPPSKIRLGTLVPKGSSYYRHLQLMGEKWRTATNGATSLTIYPDGSMGGEAEMVRRIRQGQLQAGLLTSVGLSLIEPAVSGLQNMPMMFRDLGDVDHVGEKMQPMLEERLEAKGFVVLFWGDAGWVRFFTRTRVQTPEDLKKLKLFTWAGEPATFELMRDVGMKPVALETNDILPGLKTGLIDAVPMPPFIALASQVDTAAPHMLELNYAPLVGAAVVNKAAWMAFSEEQRAAMKQAAQVAGNEIKAASRKEAEEAVEAMKKRGLQVQKPSATDEAAWRQLLDKAYPRIRGKIVPEDIFDEVKKLLEARHSEKGPKS